MLKKIIIVSVVALGIGFIVAGPALFSHVEHVFHQARSSIQNALPIEYELERAEGMIEKVGPEIEEGQKVVAQEQVEMRYLENTIARLEARQTRDAKRIKARSGMLKAEKVSYVIAGRRFQRATLEQELALAFRKYKQNEEILASKRRLLEARQRALTAAKANLSNAANARDALFTKIENLKARLREEQALEATRSSYDVDTGALTDVKEVLERCQKRLDVIRQIRENQSGATISLSEDEVLPSGNVVGEVEEYFGESPAETRTTALSTNSSDLVTITVCPGGN